MAIKKDIPGPVRRAAARFHKKRAEYYAYLADILISTRGETKLLTLFERDAQRYEGQPRGILAAHWVDRYSNNGSDLAEAWQGTFPDDEVSIIRVAQDAGSGALEAALSDVSRVARLSDKVKSEVLGTLMAAIIGLSIAIVMLALFPIFASEKLQDIYSFIPLEAWGSKGKAFVNYAEGVKANGLFVVGAVILALSWIQWSLNNWIGPRRDWADRKIVLYRAIRDIKGALFLSTMSTLTRKRGSVMFTLSESLSVFSSSVRSKWLRWRVEEILSRVDATGATNSEAFSTNLLSSEMYYYLRDTQEARGFSEGFSETGRYVESAIVEDLVKRMTVYRWSLLFVGLICVITIMAWQFSVINEMKGAMQLYYSSR